MGWDNFYWVPILQGKGLHYYQFMALIVSSICLALALISAVFYLICSKYSSKNKTLIGNIFLNSFYFFLALIPPICAGLGIINIYYSIVLTILIFYLKVFSQKQKQNHYFNLDEQTYIKKSSKIKVIKIILLSIFLSLFFNKSCISFYDDQISFYSKSSGLGFNFEWSRYLFFQKACPIGPPCHIYATLPQNRTGVFINVHTAIQIDHVYLNVNPSINGIQCLKTQYQNMEWMGQRNVFNCLVKGVQAQINYQIQIIYDGEVKAKRNYSYSDKQIKMVNGGDVGYTQQGRILTHIAANQIPDIVAIGGDIAYDNNIAHCYYTWDYLLNMLQQFTIKKGSLVPYIMGIGNHDVGVNQLSGVNVTVSAQGPAYHIYFPQHYNIDGGVPSLIQRKSFFYQELGDTLFVSLDSGYLHQFGKEQQQFMRKIFNEHQNWTKIVQYHVPLYAGCRNLQKDANHFIYGTFHWIPLFDKYNVKTVFQNHVHKFKVTKRLKGNAVHENGTLYLGDGAWGAITFSKCQVENNIDIFNKTSSVNNLWITHIRDENISHTALTFHKQILYHTQYKK